MTLVFRQTLSQQGNCICTVVSLAVDENTRVKVNRQTQKTVRLPLHYSQVVEGVWMPWVDGKGHLQVSLGFSGVFHQGGQVVVGHSVIWPQPAKEHL